ncbi:hypothetical protein H7U18_06490 [Klebsiella pneumoniae]|uniref:Uncharacterized protein n=1 Tax=Klebsiella pneumoniae TaxID=573 RepID=A0A923J7B4_KLEPN|nr:hypothetical protein [Klebsiella pneumoniae]
MCRPVSADGFRPEGARLVAISTCRKSSVVRLPLSRPDSLSQHSIILTHRHIAAGRRRPAFRADQ